MTGKVFEKVGVNVSTVGGRFCPEFAQSIPGADEDPSFFATGISLVAHMANPHVPAVHMNTRFLTTTKRWFGGGADLNPAIPYAEDTEAFHARLRAACAAHDPTFYPRFSKWAEEYFWLPHRHVARGVGGIFYDHLEGHFDAHFAFTRDVGEAFLDIFPQIVRKRMDTPFTEADMRAPARIPRPLRRVQPALRPRHLVRAQDRRQHRRHPDEPAAAGEVEMSYEPRRPTASWPRSSPFSKCGSAPRSTCRNRRSSCAASPIPPPSNIAPCSAASARLAVVLAAGHGRRRARQRSSAIRGSRCSRSPRSRRWSACSSSTSATAGECELAFVGLVPSLSGQGHGRWLLAEAVTRAWPATGSARVHVHTCSLDHPAALVRLPPRRLHALRARGRTLPRPAPARHPANGLRASGAAARHRRLGAAAAS